MDSRQEAIRMIQYWWTERGDIERYYQWDQQKENFSKINFALNQMHLWKEKISEAVEELGKEYDG